MAESREQLATIKTVDHGLTWWSFTEKLNQNVEVGSIFSRKHEEERRKNKTDKQSMARGGLGFLMLYISVVNKKRVAQE